MKNSIFYKSTRYLYPLLLLLIIIILSILFYSKFLTNTSNNSTSIKDINLNEVPYISTYYITPKIPTNEDVIINYYVTDYYHKEYTKEEYTEKFTITINIDGKKDIVLNNISAGNHSVNIGSFDILGEQKFSIIATDKYGRNSHELFNYFLITENLQEKSEYIMTKNDLISYNIKNTDTYENKHIVTIDLDNPTSEEIKKELEKVSNTIVPLSNTYTCIIADTAGTGESGNWWGETIVKYADDYNRETVLKEASNTRIGLQKLLDDKKSQGYTSIKLLPGTYRIDHLEPIYIPTNFTLDMNGSTVKLNQFTGDSALMITLNNTFDSHVINGIIEGDYYSHDYANSTNNSEWVNGISIDGESKYSSFENLIIRDITGYGGGNGIANSRDKTLGYTYLYPTSIGDTFKLTDIDRESGLEIECTNRTTSDFINIDGYEQVGYLSVSRYLGYQGNSSNTWNIVAHFYDKNQNYITSIDGYFYRRIQVPSNSKYMKITILDESYPSDLSVQYFRIPTHCSFNNIKFENCRCVGLAQAAMNNMLVENCAFTKCGQSSAKCAYDAEDGWDMMQDVTFKKLNFYNNPNNDFLTCAGHNFIIEDLKAGKLYFWERTNSYIVRNCTNISSATLGHTSQLRSGYMQFYNNTINGNISLSADNENDSWPGIIKNCIINGRAENYINSGLYIDCTINKALKKNSINTWNTALGNGNFKNCTIKNKSGENTGGVYDNCTLENITGNIHGTFDITHSTINNFNVAAGGYDPSYTFTNCDLNNFNITYGYWHQGAKLLIDNCNINNGDFLIKLPHYSMKSPITITNCNFNSQGFDGMIIFYDDRTGGLAGNLVSQDMLTIENNKIVMDNSKYVVTGINKDTVNNINITFKDNKLISPQLNLYNKECIKSKNIKITE